MIFKKIEIQNFMAIKHAEVELDNQGLVLIKGCNEDNPSFQSNGAGKSSIIESIVYVLFGRTIRGIKADEIVNNVSKCNCKVSLDLIDDDGSYYKITRYRKHKTHKNSVFLYHNSEDITPKSESDLNKEIVKILQTDYLTFTSSILYSAESFKFTQASDAEMKQAFEVMLDLGIYSKCQDEVKAEIAEVNRSTQGINLKVASVESKLQLLEESCESLKEKSENWKSEQKQESQSLSEQIGEIEQQIEELQEDNSRIDKNLDDLEKSIKFKKEELSGFDTQMEQFEELKERKAELESSESQVAKAIRNTERKISDLQDDVKSYNNKITKLQKNISVLETKLNDNLSNIGTPCPVCGRPLEEEHLQDAIDEVKTEIEDYKEQIDEYLKSIRSSEASIKKLKFTLKEYKELMEEVEEEIEATNDELKESTTLEQSRKKCSEELKVLESSKLSEEKSKARVTSKIESLQSQVEFFTQKLVESGKQKNPYESQLESEVAKIEKLNTEKDSLSEELKTYQDDMDILQFWLKGFSNSGIKSMLLDDITPFLNERANKYLQVLSGNHVHVEFSTQTQLKTGEMREKFQIKVVNEDGGDNYISNSSGEKRRIDVAINLALQDLVASRANKKLNIMFADEIFDSLDSVGIDSVMKLLKMFSTEKSSIFVVSHNLELQSEFENHLVVTKHGGYSSIRHS